MKWNPYINGLAASAYVWCVALLISHIASLHHDTPDTVVGSVSALSLVVFSASVMAFLFFYRPVQLLIENKKKEALRFFAATLFTFGLLTTFALFFVI